MKAPNFYQNRQRSNYFKRMSITQDKAREAMADLVEMGFVVTQFRLGSTASITIEHPAACTITPSPLQFVPVGLGFNGEFRYTLFTAPFGDFAVEWKKRHLTRLGGHCG
jgi:hypothetical protein